jgi:uncharacterized membrane protein (UPF0182 family)
LKASPVGGEAFSLWHYFVELSYKSTLQMILYAIISIIAVALIGFVVYTIQHIKHLDY